MIGEELRQHEHGRPICVKTQKMKDEIVCVKKEEKNY